MAYVYHLKRIVWTANRPDVCSILDLRFPSDDTHTLFPLQLHECWIVSKVDYLCETQKNEKPTARVQMHDVQDGLFPKDLYSVCPSGHVTHNFLSCDLHSACWVRYVSSALVCESPLVPAPAMFTCSSRIDRVPYPLVCDHRADCGDYSDEHFCHYPRCPGASFQCGNKQCIPSQQRCDNVEHCVNAMDERLCDLAESMEGVSYHSQLMGAFVPPLLVQVGVAGVSLQRLAINGSGGRPCPDTHFACPGPRLCLPLFLRCNHVADCGGREDEAHCQQFSGAGLYRCRASRVPLHVSHLCDGFFQCPQKDDELFCNSTCPANCTCHATAFFCRSPFSAHQHGQLRFLEGRGSGLRPGDVASNTLLVHLGLASCRLAQAHLPPLPNLRSLDLGHNHLPALHPDHLRGAPGLTTLSLAGNPLGVRWLASLPPLASLTDLDLSHLYLPLLHVSLVAMTPKLQNLNLSHSGVLALGPAVFRGLDQLRRVDLSGCPLVRFPPTVFRSLPQLEDVRADNYKLCCAVTLPPGFNLNNCQAPSDEVSSCDALLRSNLYRGLLAVVAICSLTGNTLSFVYRVAVRRSARSGFGVLVSQLCVSDFVMGVYLAVIGAADGLYRGSYLWRDEGWRHSAPCQVAGVLSLTSSEVSAFLICLITLDRFLVLHFPFSQWRFSRRAAGLACGLVWGAGLALALVPLLPGLAHWHYYSQTGICIPLPISRKTFPGHLYCVSIMIVLNSLLFLLIALGQMTIYWSIRANSMSGGQAVANRKSKDLTIARRLLTVVASDFLCWFPVGLLGLLASRGLAVPGEVNVAMAIVVLPLNSALNPFLYTLNLLQEKRRQAREARLLHRLMHQAKQFGQ